VLGRRPRGDRVQKIDLHHRIQSVDARSGQSQKWCGIPRPKKSQATGPDSEETGEEEEEGDDDDVHG